MALVKRSAKPDAAAASAAPVEQPVAATPAAVVTAPPADPEVMATPPQPATPPSAPENPAVETLQPVVAPPAFAPVEVPYSQPPALVQPTSLATQASGALHSLESRGFAGLEIGFRSFPTISLQNDGTFEDSEGNSYGSVFYCRVMGTRAKFIHRGNPVIDNKLDVAYSYDGVNTVSGIPVAQREAEWRAKGKTVETKTYLEATVAMWDPHNPDLHDAPRMLSISPTSRERLSGFLLLADMQSNGNLNHVVVKVEVGAKVTSTAQPFFPWNFSIHGYDE